MAVMATVLATLHKDVDDARFMAQAIDDLPGDWGKVQHIIRTIPDGSDGWEHLERQLPTIGDDWFATFQACTELIGREDMKTKSDTVQDAMDSWGELDARLMRWLHSLRHGPIGVGG